MHCLHLSPFIWIFVIPFVFTLEYPHEKCEFRDTVDLTNQSRLDNGSYVYQNILIPHHKLADYNYHLEMFNRKKNVDTHVRGCVCDPTNRVYCMKLCCNRGEFFNVSSATCNKLPNTWSEPTDLNLVRTKKGKYGKTVNIHEYFVRQIGLPCDVPSVFNINDKWYMFENGSLYFVADDIHLDTVSYCFTPHRYKGSNQDVLIPLSCPMKDVVSFPLLLNTFAMAISVLFIIPTIILHLLIKELSSNLGGKLLISYLISMAASYSIISYINIFAPRLQLIPCRIIGFIAYFFFISVFLWLGVLCFNIWKNFKEANVDFNAQHGKMRFVMYSIYVWGLAGVLTTIALWAQTSNRVIEALKPGIGREFCFLNTMKWSAVLYFYFPSLVILIFNIIIFTKTALKIYRVRQDVASITNRESFIQENAVVIMRLFLIMGISWIMDIISYVFRNYKISEYLFAITDLCNATQGVLIFILFIMRAKVINLIKARFRKTKTIRPRFNTINRETVFSRITSSSGATSTTPVPMSP